MPWMPPSAYEPMPNLGSYLRSISPKLNTAEFDMVTYWQWVHACLPGTCRTPAQAWGALDMTPPHARDAIDKTIVPLEIYPQVLKRAQSPVFGPATTEDDYEPMPNLGGYLRSISPKMNTAEFDMVVYWQWVHASPRQWQKSPGKAWKDLRMTPTHARDAIAEKIVPQEIYPDAYERAHSTELAKGKKLSASIAGKPGKNRPGKKKNGGASARGSRSRR